MIGLKRKIVRLVDHDPEWSDLAVLACRRVLEAGGDLIIDVQHVGSTAVPELPAKPILDLAAAVSTLDVVPLLIKKFTALGYIYRGDEGGEGGHFFIWELQSDVRTIHLHVITLDDVQWTNYLRFRDILHQDASLRKRYADLKRGLGKRYPDDRKLYSDSKHDFIRAVLSAEAQQHDHRIRCPTRVDRGLDQPLPVSND